MEQLRYDIKRELIQQVSSEQAYKFRIVPFNQHDGALVCLSDSSTPEELLAELRVLIGPNLKLEIVSSKALDDYLSANYRIAQDKGGHTLNYTPDFLEKLLLTAKRYGSSDIHFEPYESSCRIRLRLDGKLKEYYNITLSEYPSLVNKIKIKAHLDIAEKRLPQDGRISVTTGDEEFDIRVSTLPTLFGEKLVLRILNRDSGQVVLEDLGFEASQLKNYKESIRKPNGIILISGPTGSGKTTTLYATLKGLNDEGRNILTIEDPIEYTLEGVNQVQLKESIGLDFPNALRTFLRQDPDIIMVGEIRDAKTANMAIRAALTGHLVLSTIHTNSAWDTVSRLIDMGIAPFLIATTLNVSVAQRLVRKLCSSCKTVTQVDSSLFPEGFQLPKGLTKVYEPKGCNECFHTGYKGRTAIYEVLPIKSELTESIRNNALKIDSYLQSEKVMTLGTHAIRMLEEGRTSLDEIYPLLTL
jgi:type IV pilus assembly protein PilB